MILINLLPHRLEKRRLRKQVFFTNLGLSAGVGVAIVALIYLGLTQLIAAQERINGQLTEEIKQLDGKIKDIAGLRAEIDALKARQKAVEDLQTDRNMPVYLLNELVKQTPEGTYLTAIKQAGAVVTVNGVAQSNERVSELLRNTLYSSQWLERPELVEIKASTVQAAARDQRRLFDFTMKVSLKRPGAVVATPATPAAKP